RGDVAPGLVHQQIYIFLRAAQQLAVYADVIMLGVGLGAGLGDHLPVERDQAAGYELLGLSARRDSGGGDDLLQTLGRHWNGSTREMKNCRMKAASPGLSGGIILAGAMRFGGSSFGPGFDRFRPGLDLRFAGIGGSAFRAVLRHGQQFVLERFCHQLFELLHAGQLVYVLQAKSEQKFLSGLVENRPSYDRLSSRGGDQFSIQQGGDDSARIHAADLTDLRYRDWLLVRDHGQGFERREREPDRRLQALGKITDNVVMLRLGGHAISARDLANLDAAIGSSAIVGQFLKRDADA